MLPIGTKIYYTGDMANQDGHLEIVAYRNGSQYDLREIDGARDFKGIMSIATEYKGHCGDRFVTQDAWKAHQEFRIEEMKRDAMRRAYLAKQAELNA